MAKLMLFDPELADFAPVIGNLRGVSGNEMKPAKKLADLAKAIGSGKSYDELVLYYHGYTGGIMLDHNGYNLSDKALNDALRPLKTKIGWIRFEGCWVGKGTGDMWQFGQYFSAKKVSGYSWVHWNDKITVTLPRGATAQTVRGAIGARENWLAPGSQTVQQLVQSAAQSQITRTLHLEWYERDLKDAHPPYDRVDKNVPKTNFDALGRHGYRKRSEATLVDVPADKAEMDEVTVQGFEYVTVVF